VLEGTTRNISSGGVLLQTKKNLTLGLLVEVHIQWPARLETCGLKLVMSGRVVRVEGRLSAINSVGYEFRTLPYSSNPFIVRAGSGSGGTFSG